MARRLKRSQGRKRPSKPIRSTVAGWVRKLTPEDRARKLAQLYASLKETREFFAGFEARDGYQLNKLKSLSKARADAITRRAAYVRELKSRPAVAVRPRAKKSKELLNLHTGQGRIRGQKKYLYHTDTPQKTVVRVRGRKVVTLRRFVDKEGREHTAVYRNYYFPFVRKFRNWDDLMEVAEDLIRRLPNGRYRVVSSLHSDIGVPTDKKMLLQTMQDWYDTYGTVSGKEGFATTIIGFRWVGMDYKQTDFKLRQSDQIRQAYKEREAKRRRKLRDLARKRLSKGGK